MHLNSTDFIGENESSLNGLASVYLKLVEE
jgi:hypothetical protein